MWILNQWVDHDGPKLWPLEVGLKVPKGDSM